MSSTAKQPTAADLQRLLGGLIFDDIKVSQGAPKIPGDFLASYEDDHGKVLAVFCTDIGFAARAGGALAMLPSDTVEAAVKTGEISGVLLDSFREVANIVASLLCGEEYAHVRLVSLAGPVSSVGKPLQKLAESAKRRCSFDVSLGRFGSGRAFFALE